MEKQKEGYDEYRDQRESKYGRRVFHAFLGCMITGITVVVVSGFLN